MGNIPDVSGLIEKEATRKLEALGFVVLRSEEASDRHKAGIVIGTDPAADAEVEKGDAVTLKLSTGAAADAMVAVPDLSGLTAAKSREVLESFGLKQGKHTRQHSDMMPKGAVLSSTPAIGEMVPAGSIVAVEISEGPRMKWADYIVPFAVVGFGVIVILLIFWLVLWGQAFLELIAEKNVARGLITFLIAISTVGIAFILAVTTMVAPRTDDDADRFDRGKQVLTMLIGVLGTIVGFYFGSTQETPAERPQPQEEQATDAASTGVVGQAFSLPVVSTAGLTPPVTWTNDPAFPVGLSMTAEGALTGRPTVAFPTTSITITGTDNAEPPKRVGDTIVLEIR